MMHVGFVPAVSPHAPSNVFSRRASLSPCTLYRLPHRAPVPAARLRWRMTADDDDGKSKRPFPKDMSPATKELRSVLKKCSLYFVGPMGSGKTVVGKYLAMELGFRFLDTDDLIAAVARKSIAEIFEQDGEEQFRDLESAVLDQVQPFIGCCIATGGGAVLRKANWGKLQTGIVVYLEASVDVLVNRLQGDTTRPLLANSDDLRERISSILEQRQSLYQQADVTITVDDYDAVDDLGKEIIRQLTNFIKANPPRLSKLYPGNLPNK